jgi:hypothetical protein
VQSLPSLLFVRSTDTLLPVTVMVSDAVTLQGGPWLSVNIDVVPCLVHVLMHVPLASVSLQTAPRGFEQLVELSPASLGAPEFASADESGALSDSASLALPSKVEVSPLSAVAS